MGDFAQFFKDHLRFFSETYSVLQKNLINLTKGFFIWAYMLRFIVTAIFCYYGFVAVSLSILISPFEYSCGFLLSLSPWIFLPWLANEGIAALEDKCIFFGKPWIKIFKPPMLFIREKTISIISCDLLFYCISASKLYILLKLVDAIS